MWLLLPTLPESERERFLKNCIRRFVWIKWSGVTVIAVTGVIQWLLVWPNVANHRLYLICFAIKMLGAFGLVTITALLALPSEKLRGMQRRRSFWPALNLVCALTILVGAALMRYARQM